MQRYRTQYCCAAIWTRGGLPKKVGSLKTLAMLGSLNRAAELRVRTHGALCSGCSQDEIAEVLLQPRVYAGVPAGADAVRSALERTEEFRRDNAADLEDH